MRIRNSIVLYSNIATWTISKFAQVEGWAVQGIAKWMVCIALAICLTLIFCEIENILREVILR